MFTVFQLSGMYISICMLMVYSYTTIVTRYIMVRTKVMSLEHDSDGFAVGSTSQVAANCPTYSHVMWTWW